MKKETIIAIIFGVIIGGTAAFLLITRTNEKEIEKTKPVAPIKNLTSTPSITKEEFQPLEILQPKPVAIAEDKKISIKGKASKDGLVVIQSPIKEIVFKNSKTQFSIDFPLALGENIIKITVYPVNKQFNPQEKELKIYYLEQ